MATIKMYNDYIAHNLEYDTDNCEKHNLIMMISVWVWCKSCERKLDNRLVSHIKPFATPFDVSK